MYVYTEVLSVSARRGTNKCESAQQALIYKRICDMKYDICIYLWTYVNLQRGSKCEESQAKRHTWVRTTGGNIQEYILYSKRILVSIWVRKQRGSKCEDSQGTDIRKFAQHRFIYKTIYHTIYVVSVRKGTSICEFAQLGLLYKEYI